MPTLKVLDRPFSAQKPKPLNTAGKPPQTLQDAPQNVAIVQREKRLPVERKISPDRTVEETITDVPQAVELEMALLGAMIQEPENTIAQAALTLRVDSFASPVHGQIFQALCDMWDSGNKLDLLTFSQYLEDNKISSAVGGRAYVTQLFATTGGHVDAGFVQDYIRIIREKHLRRRTLRHAFALAKAAQHHNEESPIGLLRSFLGSYERLIQESEEQGGGFYDAAQLLNGHIPLKPPEIVRHVLYQGSKMILGGTSKARKTWALMDLAIAVSTGTQWWGFNTRRARVCYINLELPPWAFEERLQMICKKLGVKPAEQWLKILHLRGQAQSIEDFRRHYSLMLRSGHFGLLLLDPMYKLLGRRDENKAGDVASLCNEVDRITDETGAAIAFGGHFSKGNQAEKESIDRISGSGVFARDQDTIMTMTSHEDIDCYTVDTTLRVSPPIKQFVVRWEDPVFVRDDGKDPQQLRGSKGGRPKKWTEKDIIDEMGVGQGWKTVKLQKHLKEEFNMSAARFYVLWEDLRNHSKIRVNEEGLWFRTSLSQPSSESSESSESDSLSQPL